MQAYDEHLAEYAVERSMYEVLPPDLPTRLYFDIEYSVAERDDAGFAERLARFAELRAAFLSEVLGLSALDLSFQASTAHGESKGGYKHSVHEVLEGFYVENQEERLLFKESFEAFLEDPPSDDLVTSALSLDYERNGKSERIWDGGVYTKFRCFRVLGSCKKGCPAGRSSPPQAVRPSCAITCLECTTASRRAPSGRSTWGARARTWRPGRQRSHCEASGERLAFERASERAGLGRQSHQKNYLDLCVSFLVKRLLRTK